MPLETALQTALDVGIVVSSEVDEGAVVVIP